MTTDDIVTRLRKKYAGQLPICLEAANEIERLRKRHDTLDGQPVNWVHVAQRLVQYINETGPRWFGSVQEALEYLDSLEAADDE